MPKDDSAARGRVGPEVTSPFDVLTRFGIGWLLELFVSLAVQKLFDFFDLLIQGRPPGRCGAIIV
jgi:hypothetical protein